MAGFRKKKLEELMKRIIGDTLLKDIKDPRIGFASVYRVDLSSDYSVADIYVSVIGDKKQKRKTLAGLDAAKGYIRYHIGKSVKLRNIPGLRFHIDDSIEEGMKLVDLIEDANQGIREVESKPEDDE
jgi:ribosome-binding factor A